MSTTEKLLARLRKNPRNVTQKDFESLICSFGYIEEGGSHPKAIVGDYTLPYKRENPVKSCYVKELVGIIDSMIRPGRKKPGKGQD